MAEELISRTLTVSGPAGRDKKINPQSFLNESATVLAGKEKAAVFLASEDSSYVNGSELFAFIS